MLVHRSVFVRITFFMFGLGALAGFARAEDSLWMTDFAAAKAKAKAEKKLLLVDFTGSDWCGWCKKLVAEVFSKDEFKKEAPKKFVLVELDYPTPAKKEKQSAELQKQNEELQKRYRVQGYPSILVMDAEGSVIAKTGYQEGGPENYVKHLDKFIAVYDDVVKMTKDAEKVQGVDRVKALDKVVDVYSTKLSNPDGDAVVALAKQIVALDPDNKSGLKIKYQLIVLNAEFSELMDQEKFVEARGTADKVLTLPGATAEQKQGACMNLCECCFSHGDFVGLVGCLKKGIEAGPETEQAKQFKSLATRFQPMAEAQEEIVKLKTELEKASGIDRAKVLDKLVDAQSKLPAKRGGEELDKWSREIITLDADGKAGLKIKHEFRLLVGDAGKQLRAGKKTEGLALIDKAIALPGIKGEQIQQAHFIVAVYYLNNRDMEKGVENLKKALEADPKSKQATNIKMLIQQFDRDSKPKKDDKKVEKKDEKK
jgi:thioredoxin-related protein